MKFENVKSYKDLDMNLSEEENSILERISVPKLMKKGLILFHEGDECDRLFRIISGKVSLYKHSFDGKEISLGILSGDSMIGENSLFEETFYTYSARVIEDTYLYLCSKDEMLFLLNNPTVALDLIQQLTKKLNATTEQMANIAFYDIRGRILRTISKLLITNGRETAHGNMIDLKLSHQEIANMVNASRVMVTNILNALKGEGIITIIDKYIYVNDIEKLDQ